MIFKDWRRCSQDLVELDLEPNNIYYIHARAWHFKGYIGGTHGYLTFWSRSQKTWATVELTDLETLTYQQSCNNDTVNVFYQQQHGKDWSERIPYITDRQAQAQWFGSDPCIVDSCEFFGDIENITIILDQYPMLEFKLLNQNCNTMVSYLIYMLELPIRRPWRSVGYRTADWWRNFLKNRD